MDTVCAAAWPGESGSAPAALAASLAPATLALLDRGVRVGEASLPDVAVAGESRLVRREERREAQEADPDHGPDPDDLGREDDEVVEHEERLDDDHAERDQTRPPQHLPHLEVGRMAMECARADV